MALTGFRRGWWYLFPPSHYSVLQKIMKPQLQLQNILYDAEIELSKKKQMIYSGVSQVDPLGVTSAITQQVVDYNKRSWLIRAWWWLTGQHQEIPVKRLWLSYQSCKSFQHNMSNFEEIPQPFLIDQPQQLLMHSFVLSSWKRVIRDVISDLNYFVRWCHRGDKTKFLPVNLSTPLMEEPKIEIPGLTNYLHLCGFFKLTPFQVTSELIEQRYQWLLSNTNKMSDFLYNKCAELKQLQIDLQHIILLDADGFVRDNPSLNREYQCGELRRTLCLNHSRRLMHIDSPSLSTALIINLVGNKQPDETHEKISSLVYACGFFNLSLKDVTLFKIESALRAHAKLWHPDKTESTYVDIEGRETPYSDDALQHYRYHRGVMFDLMMSDFKKIDFPGAQEFLSQDLSNNEQLVQVYESGKSYRNWFDSVSHIEKDMAEVRTGQSEANVCIDQMNNELGQINVDLENLKKDVRSRFNFI